MSDAKYRITLRKTAKYSSNESGTEINIQDVDDIKKAISELGAFQELNMYFGPIKLGTVNAYGDNFLQFKNFMGIISYSDESATGFIMEWQSMKSVIGKEIYFEEFIKKALSKYYAVEIANCQDTAWLLLQKDWKCISRVKKFIDLSISDDETLRKEERLIFVKRRT